MECPMSPLQHKLYRAMLTSQVDSLESILAYNRGNTTTGPGDRLKVMALRNLLMQLRKTCNHPYMFTGVEPEPFKIGEHLVDVSGKLLCMDRLLSKLKKSGHKVLIFSQFVDTLDILQDYMSFRDYAHERLDGSVRGEERESSVESFQNKTSEIFAMLLSTRAGGVGITLTAADIVIFFDSDWNPQMDLQAQQRAHRIGQHKPVTVYRLISSGTVESVMLQRAEEKMRCINTVMKEADGDDNSRFNRGSLKEVFQIGASLLKTAPTEAEWSDLVHNLSYEKICDHIKQVDFSPSSDIVDHPAAASHAMQNKNSARVSQPSHTVYRYGDSDYGESVLRQRKGFDDGFDGLAGPEALEKIIADAKKERAETEHLSEKDKGSSSSEWQQVQVTKTEAARVEKHSGTTWRDSGYHSFAIPFDDDLFDRRTFYELSAAEYADNNEKADAAVASQNQVKGMHHLRGNVFNPAPVWPKLSDEISQELSVVVVPISNSGRWGRGGLFAQVAKMFPQVPSIYEAAKANHDLRLGDTLVFRRSPSMMSGSLAVALCVVMRSSTATWRNGGCIDLKAADKSFKRLQKFARHGGVYKHFPTVSNTTPPSDDAERAAAQLGFMCFDDKGAVWKPYTDVDASGVSFHVPQIGVRGREEAYAIERLISARLGSHGVPVLKYYYAPGSNGAGHESFLKPPPVVMSPLMHETKRQRDHAESDNDATPRPKSPSLASTASLSTDALSPPHSLASTVSVATVSLDPEVDTAHALSLPDNDPRLSSTLDVHFDNIIKARENYFSFLGFPPEKPEILNALKRAILTRGGLCIPLTTILAAVDSAESHRTNFVVIAYEDSEAENNECSVQQLLSVARIIPRSQFDLLVA